MNNQGKDLTVAMFRNKDHMNMIKIFRDIQIISMYLRIMVSFDRVLDLRNSDHFT